VRYFYPEYEVDLTPGLLRECRATGQRLLDEVGLVVRCRAFVDAIRGHDGVTVSGDRVRLSRRLTDRWYDAYIAEQRKRLEKAKPPAGDEAWSLRCDGFSIAVIDIETDEVRPATQRDLRELIRLVRSFGMGGSYPVTPQDVPPLMRALSCFKICWEEADNIRPFDYLDIRQTPYLFEMHRVMGQPFVVVINVTQPMTVSEHDLEVFLKFYPAWKRNPEEVSFYSICDYPMLGVSKPINVPGCLSAYLGQSFGTHVLFKLFDPELNIVPRLSVGIPVDLRHMCWAFGSPRSHLYHFLNTRALPALCGLEPDWYHPGGGALHTSSCAVDVRAGMEKMATGLIAAMQGARAFSGAGNLAVDDLFSGVQLVVDVEIFEYIKEAMAAFRPHLALLSTEGVYEVLRDVGLGKEEFYSHPDTAAKVRDLLPVSPRRPSEKLRAWMTHRRNMADLIRSECLERIRNQEPYALAEDKKRELDRIYREAEKELAG